MNVEIMVEIFYIEFEGFCICSWYNCDVYVWF